MAFKSFNKSTVTAGVRVPLASAPTGFASAVIRARKSNTGVIYLGDSTVSSATVAGLDPGDAITINAGPVRKENDLARIYIDSSVNGEGVTVYYMQGEMRKGSTSATPTW